MSNPAAIAAVPGLIRATRLSVEKNAPQGGLAGHRRAQLIGWLIYSETAADQLVEAVPEAANPPRRPPQQIHAPLGERSPVIAQPAASHDGTRPIAGKRKHP